MSKARITRLFIHNFMSLRQCTMPISPFTTYITGLNGSGKSTIQDCMSIILYGEDQNMLNYTSDNHRDVRTAMHWQTPEGSRRPGAVYSYIILECIDAAGYVYHQGVRMYSSNVGKPADMVWFTGECALEDIGIDDIDRLDAGQLTMEKSIANKNSAMKMFFERRGYPVNTFVKARFDDGRHDSVYRYRTVCRSLLNNRNIDNFATLSEYVRRQIFPATSTGSYLEDINKAFDSLQSIRNEIEVKKSRYAAFNDICQACDAWRDAKYVSSSASRLIGYLFLNRSIRVRDNAIEAMDKNQIEIESLTDSIHDMEENVTNLTLEKGRIEGSSESINRAKAAHSEALRVFEAAKAHKDQADAFEKAYADLEAFFEENGYPDVSDDDPDFADVFDLEMTRDDVDFDIKIMDLKAKSMLFDISKYEDEIKKTNEDILALRNEKIALSGKGFDDTSLLSRGSHAAKMMNDGRRLAAVIEREIPGSNPKLLCECIEDITSRKWQAAIERLIGDDRFGVIVAPEHYAKACRIQHRFQNENKIIVLDASVKGAVEKNAVVKQLVFNNEHAKNFVMGRYGNYVQCNTDDAYDMARFGVRENGQIKQGSRSVKYGSNNVLTLVFGSEAVRIEQERLDGEIARKTKSLDIYRKRIADISSEYARFSNLRNAFAASKDDYDPNADVDFAAAEVALASAEADMKIAEGSEDAAAINKRIVEIDKKIAVLSSALETNRDTLSNFKQAYRDAANKRESSNENIELYSSFVPDGFVPDEEQMGLIRIHNWENLALGKASMDNEIRNLNAVVEECHERVAQRLKTSTDMVGDLRLIYIDMPVVIENGADAQWFYDKRDQLKGDIDAAGVGGSVDNLMEALKNTYINVLNMMAGDYAEAEKVRIEFNNILTKYKIGPCRYRIGPIGVNRHITSVQGANRNLLEIALSLREGNDLSLEDQDILNQVIASTRTNKGMSGVNPFNYVDYMSVSMQFKTDKQSDWQNADRQARTNSNGQQTILRYILKLAVVDALAFTNDSIRFVMVDEVLQGVDEVNAKYFFRALADMNIQAMLSSMNMLFSYESNMTYVCAANPSDQYVIDMHYTEISQSKLDELHGTHRMESLRGERTEGEAKVENDAADDIGDEDTEGVEGAEAPEDTEVSNDETYEGDTV